MLVAIWLVHLEGPAARSARPAAGRSELQGMFLFAALAVAFLGAGRFSVGGSGGRTELTQSSSLASRPGNRTSVKPKREKSRTRIG